MAFCILGFFVSETDHQVSRLTEFNVLFLTTDVKVIKLCLTWS